MSTLRSTPFGSPWLLLLIAACGPADEGAVPAGSARGAAGVPGASVAPVAPVATGPTGARADTDPSKREIERVFLISCDTLRADRLGLYGCDADTSPALDAFAAGARVYTNAYSTTSLTHPALSALMTGRMPDEIGMSGGNRQHMPAAVVTLAEVLEAEGIATAAIVSNWVLRSLGRATERGIAQGFGHFDDEMGERELNRDAFERAGPATTDAAIAWVQDHTSSDAPFFLWVHYQDPHGPYTAPAEFERDAVATAGDRRLKLGKTHSGADQLPNYQALEKERRSEFYRARYDAEVRYFDREVGRLLDWLGAEGLLETSLLVFTADHGESLGEHDYWFCHGETVAGELVRVPFVVRSPRTEAGGDTRLTGHLDVFATVLDAFGLEPRASRGTSLLTDEPAESDRVLVQSLFRPDATVRLEAVTDGRWRLIEDFRATRLYDLDADPGEVRDLSRSNPEVVRVLKHRLKRFLRETPGPIVEEGAEAPLDEASLRALDALGYTDGEEDE